MFETTLNKSLFRCRVIPVTLLAMAGVFQLGQPVNAGWGDVGGYAPTQLPPLAPTSFDTDGDGMPDAWEDAYFLNKTNPADALSDFDMDGLNALQEYQLSMATGGQYGNPLGKWSATTLPALPGFSTPPSVVMAGCASNGIIVARVQGKLAGSNTTTTYPYTWSPLTGQWTRIAPPGNNSSITSLVPLDVNAAGQVVGYYYAAGAKRGFVWSPSPGVGQTNEFILKSNGTNKTAVPEKIGDSGHTLGYVTPVSGTRFAARPDGSAIVFSGFSDQPYGLDVNGFGEFISIIFNPVSMQYESALLAEGCPPFLTNARARVSQEFPKSFRKHLGPFRTSILRKSNGTASMVRPVWRSTRPIRRSSR